MDCATSWASKPIEDWSQEETINWLMMAASCLGQSYGTIQQALALPGKELAALGRHDFIARDPVYGERLYNLLHTQAVSSQCKSLEYFAPRHHSGSVERNPTETGYQKLGSVEDEPTHNGSNNASGEC